MTTAATSLLGLALPVTGELAGTWGDTVNNSITSLLDSAVAGTTTLSTDGDVTLTTTTLAANQARQAILLCSGARTAQRTITAPAQSKIYTIINATTGGFSVKLVGAGPTTGVTIVAGESAVCAWNGSDFIKVSNTGGSASFTNVAVSGTTTLSGLTASTALALNSSKEVVSVTNTGTGNNVLSASPTLTGTVAGASLQLSSLTATRVTYAGASGLLQDSANLTFDGTSLTLGGNPTLSGGTANGVLYLNGSKVATSGSALVFDGTNLGLGVTPSAWGSGYTAFQTKNTSIFTSGTTDLNFGQNVYVNSGGNYTYISNGYATLYNQYAGKHYWSTAASGTAGNAITFTQAMTLDASGRLAVGTTSASAQFHVLNANGNSGLGSDNTGMALVESTYAANASQANASYIAKNYYGYSQFMQWQNFGVRIGSRGTANGGAGALVFTYGNDSEGARIDSSGNLLVGATSNPGILNKSVVVDSGASNLVGFVMQNDTTGRTSSDGGAMLMVGAEMRLTNYENNAMLFSTNNTERARIDSSGNFMAGRTSALAGARISAETSSGSPTFASYAPTTGTEYAFDFVNPNGIVGSITTNGSATLYNISSDQRLKENIADADSASTLIDSLQVRKFDWKAGDHQRYGFVAQELVTVAPEAVHQPADPEEMMAVDYSKLVPMLVKEIQSLRARVAQLESN